VFLHLLSTVFVRWENKKLKVFLSIVFFFCLFCLYCFFYYYFLVLLLLLCTILGKFHRRDFSAKDGQAIRKRIDRQHVCLCICLSMFIG